MRLIDADALLDIYERNSITDKITIDGKTIMQHLNDAPTIDVEHVVHAEWLIVAETWDDGIEADEDWYVKCSHCGRNNYDVDVFKLMDGNIEDVKRDFPYCHCGARMDGDAE